MQTVCSFQQQSQTLTPAVPGCSEWKLPKQARGDTSKWLPKGVKLADLEWEEIPPIPAVDDIGNPEILSKTFDTRQV
jgi:hypothetical protein